MLNRRYFLNYVILGFCLFYGEIEFDFIIYRVDIKYF